MQPISVEAFASMVMKNNKGYRKKELVKTLNETLTAKKNGAKCMICLLYTSPSPRDRG